MPMASPGSMGFSGQIATMPTAIFERENLAKGGDRPCQLIIVASNLFTDIYVFN